QRAAHDCDEQRCFRCGLHHAETTEPVLDPQTRCRDLRGRVVGVSRVDSRSCSCQRDREEGTKLLARPVLKQRDFKISRRNICTVRSLRLPPALVAKLVHVQESTTKRENGDYGGNGCTRRNEGTVDNGERPEMVWLLR